VKPAWLAPLPDRTSAPDSDGLPPPEASTLRGVMAFEHGLRLLAEHVPVAVWSCGPDLKASWEFGAASLAGLDEHLRGQLEGARGEGAAATAHREAMGGTASTFEMDWQGRRLRAYVEPLRDEDGRPVGVIGLAQDEDGAPGARGIDPLTGLPDRSHLLTRLRRSTAPGWCVDGLFMLLLDLDRFHDVNERHGYAVGDALLAEVASRLRRRLRPTDVLTRFGDDRFAILLGGVKSGPDAVRVADRLAGEVGRPFESGPAKIKPSASIGIAVGTAGARAEDVVRDAERALSRAIVMGRRAGLVTAPSSDTREASLLQVETALRRALEQEDIRAIYRPVVSRKEGKVAGFEVVLWRKPLEGELPAGKGAISQSGDPNQPRRNAHLAVSRTGEIVKATPTTTAQSTTDSGKVPNSLPSAGT
jgi:diguanylate cyclase (GGDEF)-like protein